MVHHHLAVHRFAHLYLVFLIVVDGLPEYLSVREAVATAFLHVVQNVGHALVYVLGRVAVVLAKSASSSARCSRYICIVLLKWSVPFISLSFLDCLFQYLSPIGRLYLTEKEVHEVLPCVLVQFVVQSSESAKIAVNVRFHHILEDVVHFVVPALLRCRLAVSLCHIGKG